VRKDGREKKKKKREMGGRGVFIIFQWLKDRKELGWGTSFDKQGRHLPRHMERAFLKTR
jgi:hypothetical protein